MSDEEKGDLIREYDNLKLLAEFHSTYRVIESNKEREKMIDDILDRLNEIRKKLDNE